MASDKLTQFAGQGIQRALARLDLAAGLHERGAADLAHQKGAAGLVGDDSCGDPQHGRLARLCRRRSGCVRRGRRGRRGGGRRARRGGRGGPRRDDGGGRGGGGRRAARRAA